MYYLTMHSTHLIYGHLERNVLFNDALRSFGVGHMVTAHLDNERVNPVPPYGLLFPISSKGSFICIIPQTKLHIPRPLLHQSLGTGWNDK